jgi:hypothetical protein
MPRINLGPCGGRAPHGGHREGKCRENDRVCPLLPLWDLGDVAGPLTRRRGLTPPPPLILAAWHDNPAMLNMLRLAEHIEWATKHESLGAIGKFLRELREDWYHIGD